MNVRVLGGGWYGCHTALCLLRDGHSVRLYDVASRLFAGASGNNPARCHGGAHYPRSTATRLACQEQYAEFSAEYGRFTRGIPTNIYAIAREHSLIDFATYTKILTGEIEFVRIERPEEYGLRNVEGAILTGERHIVIDEVRAFFERELAGHVELGATPCEVVDSPDYDLTIDATFCANEADGINRYEPCLILLLRGDKDRAVTVMNGAFSSIYPWDREGVCSLSSAKFTPFSKQLSTYRQARMLLDNLNKSDIEGQGRLMLENMAHHYPAVLDYEVLDYRFAIRAMQLSAADSRTVDIVNVGERAIRIRAGKIISVIEAAKAVRAEVRRRTGNDRAFAVPCGVGGTLSATSGAVATTGDYPTLEDCKAKGAP